MSDTSNECYKSPWNKKRTPSMLHVVKKAAVDTQSMRPGAWESPCDDLELLRSEWPGLPSTELHRRLDPPPPVGCLSVQSSPAPLCRLVRRDPRGMCWNVSRRNDVISISSWHATSFSEYGQSDPVWFTVAEMTRHRQQLCIELPYKQDTMHRSNMAWNIGTHCGCKGVFISLISSHLIWPHFIWTECKANITNRKKRCAW